MNKDISDVSETKIQGVGENNNARQLFQENVVRLNALTSIFKENMDVELLEKTSQDGLKALNARGGLQQMLVAQMLSVYQLQQQTMILANSARQLEHIRYFTNTAIKLANCFAQQVNALNRLQGNVSQKITVEHVDVHSGGQAVVGNINGSIPVEKVKK